MSLTTTTFNTPTLKIGLGGNYYIICNSPEKLAVVCEEIDKSLNSIYYNKKYSCFAIRIKSNHHKKKIMTLDIHPLM